MKPKRIWDEIVADHATSYTTHSVYLNYFYRHLLIKMEMMANYAHQILSEGSDSLI